MTKKPSNIDELRAKLKREDDAARAIEGQDPGAYCYPELGVHGDPELGVHGGFVFHNDNDNPRCHCGAVTYKEYFGA